MADKETKELLRENLKKTDETLRLVKNLDRARKWSRFFTIAKWTLIIGLLVFGFVKLQPYIESFSQALGQISELLSQFNINLPSSPSQQ